MDRDKDIHHQRASRPSHNDQGFSIDDQQAGFVMGAVVGAIVGGAAALLLSPKNGKEMREIVKKYSKDLESEAYDLAKETRGVAKSFKSVLEDGATEVMEQAPEKLEQASHQAQQLAGELNEKFESARDVVAELAEAFRSGWEEYGEDRVEEEEFEVATPILFDTEESAEVKPVIEEVAPPQPMYGRRRTHEPAAYSMHATNESTVEKAAAKEEDAKEVAPKSASKDDKGDKTEKVKESEPKEEKRTYTTRVVEKPRKVSVAKPKTKTDDKDEDKKAAAKPKKKLLFRRNS